MIVCRSRAGLEADLAAGRVRCLACSGPLGGWVTLVAGWYACRVGDARGGGLGGPGAGAVG